MRYKKIERVVMALSFPIELLKMQQNASEYLFIIENLQVMEHLFSQLESQGVDVSGPRLVMDKMTETLRSYYSRINEAAFMLHM